MAALRAAENAIEDSGLNEAWSEADIWPTTTRHILEAKHMKRALEAHMTTVQALYDLYVEEFFLDHPHLKGPCVEAAQQFDQSCVQHLQQEMLKEQQNMLTILDSQRVLKMMAEFDNKKGSQSSLSRLSDHLTSNNLINSHQSAYCKHHSTETALLYINDHLINAISSRKISCLCLLDLSAAFDTIDHNILLVYPLGLAFIALH